MDDQSVAVLLENLSSQFETYEAGLELLFERMEQGSESVNHRLDILEQANRLEHMQLMQLIKDLLDREAQVPKEKG